MSPAELVDKVLALTAGELRVADIKVEKNVDPDVPRVWADGNQLQQVLVNLITNAKHAMEDIAGERRLGISLRRSGPDHIRVRVEDSGPGIPAELISKVFDPFITTKSEGTGLGLSISYGIISEHGGRIRVESPRGPGRGVHHRAPDRDDRAARARQHLRLTPATIQAGAGPRRRDRLARMTMRYRPFGRTGLSVSVVGFGCWPMAGDRYGAIEDDEAVKAIHRALDRGVNCVDTAPAYGGGHSEEVVARALERDGATSSSSPSAA